MRPPPASWDASPARQRRQELLGPLRLTLDQLDDVPHDLAQLCRRLPRAVGHAGVEGIFEIGHRHTERLQETPCDVLSHASLPREDVWSSLNVTRHDQDIMPNDTRAGSRSRLSSTRCYTLRDYSDPWSTPSIISIARSIAACCLPFPNEPRSRSASGVCARCRSTDCRSGGTRTRVFA